jgi:alkylated DNA repair protein alkB homolog 6
MPNAMASLTGSAYLEDYKIRGIPSSAFYISEFISEAEQQALLDKVRMQSLLVRVRADLKKIEQAPKPRWKQLSKRRLQTWPSDLTKNTLLDAPLPKWLIEPIITRIHSIPLTSSDPQKHMFSDSPHGGPNHVLINEYLPGQGIMPHKDGAAYHPVVCTVSLGSSLCLDLYGTKDDGTIESEPRAKILQEPRSLLITTGELYTNYLHGIAEVDEEVNLGPSTVSNWELLRSTDEIIEGRFHRLTRTSLTYRDVIKVSKLGAKLGIFGNR